MQKMFPLAKQVKSQYLFSWVHLLMESNGQNQVSGFGSLPLQFSPFDLSDYVLIFLIFQALNTAKCAAASVGCIYILKRNWLCILGHSFVSSCIRVYVYLFIFLRYVWSFHIYCHQTQSRNIFFNHRFYLLFSLLIWE